MAEFDDGRSTVELRVSHPDRVLFPVPGITKKQLMDYYAHVSAVLLPYYRNRVLTVKRWPHGITGSMFYQKHAPTTGTDVKQAIRIDSVEDLLQWVARGVIEWHVPLGLAENPDDHDWAVFDLDPHQVNWEKVVEATGIMIRLLDLLEIPCVLKTSGQQGMHIYIKIQPESHHHVKIGCQLIAQIAAATYPHLLTLERLKRNRGRRVYIDYLQNAGHKTMAGVYSVRAVPQACVSCPLTVREIGRDPEWWTMDRVIERIKQEGDLFQIPGSGIFLTRHLRERGISEDKLRPWRSR